jgi:hypothetical protein
MYAYKYTQNIYQKVGPVEETREKKERKIVNNKEMHYICVGTRYNKTH